MEEYPWVWNASYSSGPIRVQSASHPGKGNKRLVLPDTDLVQRYSNMRGGTGSAELPGKARNYPNTTSFTLRGKGNKCIEQLVYVRHLPNSYIEIRKQDALSAYCIPGAIPV